MPRDLPDLYRCRSLCDAGIGLALSSDAPYGPIDRWQVIAASTERGARDGSVVGPEETITAAAAVDRCLAPLSDPGGLARRIKVGAVADLALLDRPMCDVLSAPTEVSVVCTVIDGTVVYER